MQKYNKNTLSRQAKDLGFIRDTLEKMLRLSEILSFFNNTALLSENLALKGGTAINLTIFNLPRLSLDLDLDLTKNISRAEMLDLREHLSNIINKYMSANEYVLSPKTKQPHSLDSFVYSYENAAGTKDNIKIEINYSLRSHILPCENRIIEIPPIFEKISIYTLAPIEIFAGKIVALLSRVAARDLYDINNMIYYGLFSEEELPLLRKCVIFYSAIGNKEVPLTYNFGIIDTLTKHKIRTDLLPVLRNTDQFDLAQAQKRVKEFLRQLLVPEDSEKMFLESFASKEYRPDLLFDDKAILERLASHPMALWKMRQNSL